MEGHTAKPALSSPAPDVVLKGTPSQNQVCSLSLWAKAPSGGWKKARLQAENWLLGYELNRSHQASGLCELLFSRSHAVPRSPRGHSCNWRQLRGFYQV